VCELILKAVDAAREWKVPDHEKGVVVQFDATRHGARAPAVAERG